MKDCLQARNDESQLVHEPVRIELVQLHDLSDSETLANLS